jgi:hypothetical protein
LSSFSHPSRSSSSSPIDVLGAGLSGVGLDVLGAVLSGVGLDVLGAVLSGVGLDVLGPVLSGAEVDVLELSIVDRALTAVVPTLVGADATEIDELDPIVLGTVDVGGAESNWAAAKPPSPSAIPTAPTATMAVWREIRLRTESGSELAMWFLQELRSTS